MVCEDFKFEYLLESSGWAKIIFEIDENKFEYYVSYTYQTLDQILSMAWDVLEYSAKEGSNSCFFIIHEEGGRNIEFHFLFEVGQNKNADLKIIEKNGYNDQKIINIGVIDYYHFIRQVLNSATNILKNFGLIGYSIEWGHSDFPLTDYLRTLDFFEDYHNLDYLTVIGNQTECGYFKSNIYDEIKLLSKHLGQEYQPKDIYYYLYKGNLLELENHTIENLDEIDKLLDNDHREFTPLVCAIRAGMESAALMLIRYGANINLADNYQHTTLHYAVDAHSYHICRKLIEMNKDLVNTPNNAGRTPIFNNIPNIKNQTEDGNDYRIFDLFLQNDVDLFHKALNKSTPMDLIEANKEHYNNNLLEYIKTNYPKIKL